MWRIKQGGVGLGVPRARSYTTCTVSSARPPNSLHLACASSKWRQSILLDLVVGWLCVEVKYTRM